VYELVCVDVHDVHQRPHQFNTVYALTYKITVWLNGTDGSGELESRNRGSSGPEIAEWWADMQQTCVRQAELWPRSGASMDVIVQ
jgi:hypothetical protein